MLWIRATREAQRKALKAGEVAYAERGYEVAPDLVDAVLALGGHITDDGVVELDARKREGPYGQWQLIELPQIPRTASEAVHLVEQAFRPLDAKAQQPSKAEPNSELRSFLVQYPDALARWDDGVLPQDELREYLSRHFFAAVDARYHRAPVLTGGDLMCCCVGAEYVREEERPELSVDEHTRYRSILECAPSQVKAEIKQRRLACLGCGSRVRCPVVELSGTLHGERLVASYLLAP